MDRFFSRIQRNHGLEHATLHILGQLHPNIPIAGHSDQKGFWIVGNVPAEMVLNAAQQAISRLKNGESRLAIHPNCGTNLVTTGIFSGAAAWLALMGSGNRFRDRLERLPLAVVFATLAVLLSRPLGLMLQEHLTTSGNPGNLELVGIRTLERGGILTHRLVTRG